MTRGVHAAWQPAARRHSAIFAVEGMRCSACSRAVEKRIAALPGVRSVAVNVASARCAVEWDEGVVTLAPILEAVKTAGFRPVPLCGEGAALEFRDERRTAIKRIGFAGLAMMQTMMFMYGLYAAGSHGIEPRIANYLRLVTMLVATPVLFYSGAPFFQGAWRSLRNGALGMDVPVALALALAYGASVVNTLRGSGEIYFDSVTMFVFFLLAGRFMEMSVRHRSLSASEALARSLPATAVRLLPDGATQRVPVAELRIGDRVQVPRGAVIPVDGVLESAQASIDEALVSGESVALVRSAGAVLPGGAVNAGAPLVLRAMSVAGESRLALLVGLLSRTQAQRPRVSLAAERTARWFIAAVLAIAAVVALAWWQVDPSRAFAAVLAVLVVTCPCALSLATPTAIAAAGTQLSRDGVLLTRADALERLAQVDTIVLDKTGTLTAGTPQVEFVDELRAEPRARILALAAALERASDHPLAGAFRSHEDAAVVASAVSELPGKGLEGRIEGHRWRLGTRTFACGASMHLVPDLDGAEGSAGESGLWLANDDGPVGRIVLTDVVRADARAAVDALRELGLAIVLASGDAPAAVARIARQLGIRDARARLTPEDKLAMAGGYRAAGHRMMMIGDGINDGPVLAAAHVSCAMGGGSAVAQAASDLMLLGDSLLPLAAAILTARRTVRVMRQNLRWAFCYNVIAIPLAAFGLVAPWVAALGMSTSSLIVVLNSNRLARQARP
jgi:Cu2+-exporting ATPase